jgi:hypothetical protein
MLVSATVPKYNDMEMRWSQTFWLNNGYPQVSVADGQPDEFDLSQNFPNPFNPTTAISFQLPERGQINLSIYDLNGQKLRTLVDGIQDAGHYTVNFHAGDLPSGVYLYRLTAGSDVMTKKMVLMK